MTEYTIGNYTVNDNYVDTNSASPKDISVPDLDPTNDYVLRTESEEEIVVVNTTSSDLLPKEAIRFAKSTVNNVYSSVKNVDASLQTPTKQGVQVMVEITSVYTAVNSVSGDEYHLPVKGRVVLAFPTHSSVTEDMVADMLGRTIGAVYDEGSVDESRIMSMIRGSLTPK